VKGPAQNADLMRLRALVEDTSGQTPPSKLLVAGTPYRLHPVAFCPRGFESPRVHESAWFQLLHL
jgi:hypothetical protein